MDSTQASQSIRKRAFATSQEPSTTRVLGQRVNLCAQQGMPTLRSPNISLSRERTHDLPPRLRTGREALHRTERGVRKYQNNSMGRTSEETAATRGRWCDAHGRKRAQCAESGPHSGVKAREPSEPKMVADLSQHGLSQNGDGRTCTRIYVYTCIHAHRHANLRAHIHAHLHVQVHLLLVALHRCLDVTH